MSSDNSSSEASSSSSEEELNVDEDGRVALSGGSMDYSARGFDNAVFCGPNASTYEAFLADCSKVFTARATGVGEELSAGCTFWTPADAKPSSALERLALQIFAYHTRDAQFDPSSSGAEWWTQVIDPEDDIGLHWDRDYDMEADQGLLIHPHLATVTYVCTPPGAAPTLVLDCASPLLSSESPCGPVDGAVACWPSQGRHFCFDGRLLHGAMSDLSSTISSSGGGGSGGGSGGRAAKRVTFLVNIWLNHAPWGAEELPASVRSQLSKLPSVKVHLGGKAATLIQPSAPGGGGSAKAKAKASSSSSGGSKRGKAAAAAASTDGEGATKQLSFTFGGGEGKGASKGKLALTLPWPAGAIAAQLETEASAPVLRFEFERGAAEVAPAASSSKKRKK